MAIRSSTPVLWCLVTPIYVLFRLWCRWNRSLLGTTRWWLVKVVNQTWPVPLWDTSPVGCFIVSSINFDSHLCLRWLYGQTTGEEPELHFSQLGHKRKHEIVGKDVKISSSTYKSFNVGKFSRLRHWWLALLVNPRGPCPKTGPVKEAVSVTWNVFFVFFCKGGRVHEYVDMQNHAECFYLCSYTHMSIYIYILCTVMIHDAILLYCRKRFHAQSLFLAHLIFILITECSTSYIHSLFNHICIYSIVYIYISYITYCLSLSIFTHTRICVYMQIFYIMQFILFFDAHVPWTKNQWDAFQNWIYVKTLVLT